MAKRDPYGKPPGMWGFTPFNVTTPAAPSAPAASAAPAPVKAPDFRDATYNDAIGGATLSRDNTLAYLAGQHGRLRSSYGYADDNFTVDPSNPFGQAQLLTRAYQQSQRGTQNSYAARGQQTSGAYGRMQNANLFDFQQRNDALQKNYLNSVADLGYQTTQATDAYGAAQRQAATDALGRALQARQPVQAGPVDTDPIVNTYYNAQGQKVNVHASGRKATIKKKR